MIPPARELAHVALNTFVIYAYLLALLRLVGRRQLGQLTSIDLVIIVALGSAVETAMIAGNTSLPAGLVSAGTLLVLNWIASRVALRWRRVRRLLVGSPTLLVHDGRFVEENLHRTGFTHADVLQALRERECGGPAEVRYAVLEADGTIHCVRADAEVHQPGDEDSRASAPKEPQGDASRQTSTPQQRGRAARPRRR